MSCQAYVGQASQTPSPLQVSPGVYNEFVFQRLDLIINEAGKNGIRLICALANTWDEYGGVQWCGSSCEFHQLDASDADGI